MSKSNRVALTTILVALCGGISAAQEVRSPVTDKAVDTAGRPIANAPPVMPEPAPAEAAQDPAVNSAPMTAPTPAAAGLAGMLWTGVKDWVVPIVLLLAPLISYFVLRAISVRLVLHYMMRKAPQGSATPFPEDASVAKGAHQIPGELEFLNLNNTNGVLLNGSAEDRLERAEESARRSFRPLFLSVLAGFGAWVAVVTAKAVALPEMRAVALPAIGAGVALFLVILLIGGYCYRMVNRLTAWMSITLCLLTLAAGIAVWKLAQVPPYFTLIPGIAQGATAWLLVRRVHLKMLAAGNKHLLILRVFGSDKSTAFTFGTLMDKWRFVGSFLTIVDPSYIRYQFAAISPFRWRRTAASTIWYGLAAGILGAAVAIGGAAFPELLPESLRALPLKEQTQMLANAGYLILIPLAILPIFLYVTSKFAKSQAEAAQRIGQAIEHGKKPRLGIFRGIPMWCFDDVWRPSVRQMLSNADAILMDLRGFTPERKGCAYEIGELIDRCPIERVLFLIHENSDQQALYALIHERWSRMSPDSPNCAARKALLKVYETNPRARARQVRKDVSRILGLLSACVDENATGDAPLKSLVQMPLFQTRISGDAGLCHL